MHVQQYVLTKCRKFKLHFVGLAVRSKTRFQSNIANVIARRYKFISKAHIDAMQQCDIVFPRLKEQETKKWRIEKQSVFFAVHSALALSWASSFMAKIPVGSVA